MTFKNFVVTVVSGVLAILIGALFVPNEKTTSINAGQVAVETINTQNLNTFGPSKTQYLNYTRSQNNKSTSQLPAYTSGNTLRKNFSTSVNKKVSKQPTMKRNIKDSVVSVPILITNIKKEQTVISYRKKRYREQGCLTNLAPIGSIITIQIGNRSYKSIVVGKVSSYNSDKIIIDKDLASRFKLSRRSSSFITANVMGLKTSYMYCQK